ncbi:maleylpyruvate isomerase N-terminal domain-containing protein [Mycobacterium sp. NPDC051804]|uniref:maleylpyruvate isomerase N-terminal domain-containing protein n=1 Tax=Mycobacterium sp. NPDC051804 TaxID=3364295 RepID=UPI0037BDDB4F
MGDLRVDLAEARRRLAAVAHRVADLLADEFDGSRSVPGLDWTLGDTAAHVAAESRSFARLASGDLTPESMWEKYAPGTEGMASGARMSTLNRNEIAAFDRSQLSRAGELIEEAVGDFLATTRDWPSDRLFRGIEGDIALPTATCVVMFELLIHGDDLARGLGKRWVIAAEEARLVLSGISSLMPGQFDADAAGDMRATVFLRLRGGPAFALWVHDGRLEVVPHPVDPVDCHVWADPVTFLLVSTGRRSQIGAVLRGKLMAWGRRPWLAARLPLQSL